MLAYINQMKIHLEVYSSRFDTYDNISQDILEESMMNYLYQTGNKNNPYRTAIEFWKDQKVVL